MTEHFIDKLRALSRGTQRPHADDIFPQDLVWAESFYKDQQVRFEYAASIKKRAIHVACCYSFDEELCSFEEAKLGVQEGWLLRGRMRALQAVLKWEEFLTEIRSVPECRGGSWEICRVQDSEFFKADPRVNTAPHLNEVPDADLPPDYDLVTLIARW